ncbi:MAG: AhpC/TSA family protein [Chitinophagales bacterium]|nr:AhpC/TSA family protein [Chitinophagaceae bacterium]MCB9064558.1 AhpC/TSA family protein [Chitinophagales bacterium]
MKQLTILFLSVIFSLNSFGQLPENRESVCPLPIGSKVPDMQLVNTDGKQVSIKDMVSKKPTVLIFYRGGWCPYCNAHLSEIGKVEQDILKAGYQVVAISPDMPEELNHTIDKKELKYTLLSDGDGAFSTAMGIAYQAPDSKWKTNQLQKYSGGKNKGYLPVPSVFVLDKSGEIIFEYVNPNYKKRLSAEVLLGVLRTMNQ